MFADDFLLGQSVHLQKQSFKSFLQKGLIEEFQNFFPFITSFGRESQINETSTSHQSHTVTRSVSDIQSPYTSRDTYKKNTFVFFLDVQNYVLKKPKISAQKALQSGETYKAEIYIPGRWFFNNLPITSTSFLFLGELPLLTEEGHFILNGSPRTVVGQLVRSPGIYYKIKLGRKNRRRHLISFLSENGCWFRIWTDQWGRVWARINKLRRIPLFVLLRSLGFTDSLLIRMISDLSFLWKSYRKFIETYFFANSIHKAILFLYFDLHRSSSKKPVFLHACDFIYRTFFQSKTYSFGKSGRFYLDLKLGRYPQLSQTLKPEDVLDGIEKLIQLESGYCWVDNIDHLQNRRVRLVNELLQNELNRGLKSFQTIYKQKLQTLYLSSIFHDLKLYPVNYTLFKKFYHTFSLRSDQSPLPSLENYVHTMRESQVSNEYRDLINPLLPPSRTTYLLPPVAETSLRETKFGVKFCSSFRSVTRRRYIIGERVMKNQKKHLRNKNFCFFKLKKKNDKILISLGSDQSHIIKYGVLERRERGLIRSPLTSTVCSEETFVSSLKPDSNFFTNRNKKLSIKPNGLFTRIYGPHLRSPSTATRLDLFSESEANNGFYEFLLNPHSITKAFQQFFGLHPLSQLLDQSNPLSAAAHKRRLTSLGPGGVNRDAGLAVRDIHPSHYGRLCPIETPEGKNAGLVHSLALYAHLNNLGAVQTPFLVKNKLRETNVNFQNQSKSFLFSSEQEFFLTKGKPIFFGNPFLVKETCLYEQSEKGKSLIGKKVASLNKEIYQYNKSSILVRSQIIDQNPSLCCIGEPVSSYNSVPAGVPGSYIRDKSPTSLRSYNSVPLFFSVSPTQILSLATSLIPFLEHDDANRALMGSNMQRQAVSLLYPEKPIVGTGFEKIATQGISTKTSGIIYSVNATRILVRTQKRLHIYPFNTFSRSNQATCLEEKPFVKEGEIILKGTSFGDKESTYGGDLSIGTNLLLGYMPWEGYNFEDAVVISERLVIEDVYTSIHIEKYTVNIDKRFGEELTPYPPNIPNDESYHLDNNGIIEKGVFVQKQSLLIGKRKPLDDKKMTPTFKLRAKIFQVKPPFYEDTSFRLMRGSGGRVLRVQLRLDRDSSEAKIETNFAFSKLIYSIKLPTRFARIESPLASLENYVQTVRTELNKQNEVRDLSPLTQENIKYRTKKKKNYIFAKEEKYKFLEYLSFHQRSSFFPKKMSEHKPNQTWIEKENFYEKYNSFSFCYKLNFQINSFLKISHSKQTIFQQKNNVLHSSVSGTLYPKQVFNKRSLESEASPYKYVRSSRPKGEGIDKDIKTIKNIDSIQIFIATKRRIQIGDKVAGRHGNKGIVCLILPQSNMPYLQDGTPLDVVLNPLGVPSRMNLGQLFESLLGLAGKHLRQSYKIVAFDEIHSCVRGAIDVNPEQYVRSSQAKGINRKRQVSSISKNIVLQNCFNAKKKTGYSWLFNSNIPGKMYVFDGRTGRPFLQPIMVGLSYMLKLVHLVDDKIHARLTGPYGLVSQQPLRGKARDGGQRLGEMEVWAFEGYGAAYTLHELLTLKSDDMEARSRLFSSLVKGDSIWGHENTKSYSIFNMMFLRSSSFKFDTINSTLLGDLSLRPEVRSSRAKREGTGTELNKQSEFREQSKIPINPRLLGTRFAPQASLFQSDKDYIFEKYNKTYQNKKKKKTHNFPESLQVVFSELQALCLDVSLIQF